jgi:hypothetical protein
LPHPIGCARAARHHDTDEDFLVWIQIQTVGDKAQGFRAFRYAAAEWPVVASLPAFPSRKISIALSSALCWHDAKGYVVGLVTQVEATIFEHIGEVVQCLRALRPADSVLNAARSAAAN